MKILKSGFQAYSLTLLIFLSFFITGCGGGGGGGSTTTTTTVSEDTNGSDTYIADQWYLESSYLNLLTLHSDYNGSTGTIIQICDTGIEKTHEDFLSNIDLSKSYNAETATAGDCTPDSGENHGTLCAGVAAARGYNDKGIRGVSPLSKVVGFKFTTLPDGSLTYDSDQLSKAWLSGSGADDITVSSNSWGSCFSDSTMEEDVMAQGSTLLRGGKGRVYVFAAGNGRMGSSSCSSGDPESANTTYMANSQYSITVASLGKDDKYANYSNQGSNILISAYGSDSNDVGINIKTTDLGNSYSDNFIGTSAATPMVAGSVALVLEACPSLTYRDVKYILAKTATQIDSNNSTWITNYAGLKHSIDYGYGKINVSKAIDMCKGQGGYSTYTNLTADSFSEDTNSTSFVIPNNDSAGVDINITVTENKTIEWVGVVFNVKLDRLGDFQFTLTSPSGTTTKLLHSSNGLGTLGTVGTNDEFRLSSVAFVDENSSGTWTVNMADQVFNNQTNRTLNSVKLKVVGH